MTIPRFDTMFSAAIETQQAAADLLRYVRDSKGDLQSSVILDHIPRALAQAKAGAVGALTECAKDVDAANVALTRYPGAPQTVDAFQAAVKAVEMAAHAWNTDLGTWLAGLVVSDLLSIQAVDLGAGKVAQFVWAQGFNGAKIAPIRQSPGLAALIASLEAAGATA